MEQVEDGAVSGVGQDPGARGAHSANQTERRLGIQELTGPRNAG
jgi:hypothetical protein